MWLGEQSRFVCWAKKKIPKAVREPQPQPKYSETKGHVVNISREA